eukprot:Hpha_TRINITY_DN12218_c0_g1::TRINITY_DN12218_c0_g1_i1::g.17155::m.17155
MGGSHDGSQGPNPGKLLETAVIAGLRSSQPDLAASKKMAKSVAVGLLRSLSQAGVNTPDTLLRLAEGSPDSDSGSDCASDASASALCRRIAKTGHPPLPLATVSCLAAAVRLQRLETKPPPSAPGQPMVLFTAPHCLYLCRDQHKDHPAEEYTGTLARGFAAAVGGGHLTWARHEQKRVNAKKRGCPSNRDPNFLLATELERSPWTQQLRALRKDCPLTLHCDIHGCKDPHTEPHHYKAHVHVGLAAMEQAGREDVPMFRAALQEELDMVLGPRGFIVDAQPRCLVGSWVNRTPAHCGRRMTVTQQAVQFGYSHAIQLELAHSLRQTMAHDDTLKKGFSAALVRAWGRVGGWCGSPPRSRQHMAVAACSPIAASLPEPIVED